MCVCVCVHKSFNYSLTDGHLGHFHTLASVNNAAMNMEVQISFPVSVFVSSEHILRSYYVIFDLLIKWTLSLKWEKR